MREVYPLLRQSLPNLRFDIIGDNPSAAITDYDSEAETINNSIKAVSLKQTGQ